MSGEENYNLEDVLRKAKEIGEIQVKENDCVKKQDYFLNLVMWIDDGIGKGDTWNIMDFLVYNWEYGKKLKDQSDYYKRFFEKMMDLKDVTSLPVDYFGKE